MTSPFFLFMQESFMFLGGISYLIREIVRELFKKGNSIHLLTEQIFQIGHRSLSLVLVTAVCTGAVMTL